MESPAEPQGAEVQLGIWPSDARGWVFHWLVLLSGALESPRRSEQAQVAALPLLCSLLPRQEALLLEGAPRQQIKALHKEEKKKAIRNPGENPNLPQSLIHPSINTSITLPGKYRTPK